MAKKIGAASGALTVTLAMEIQGRPPIFLFFFFFFSLFFAAAARAQPPLTPCGRGYIKAQPPTFVSPFGILILVLALPPNAPPSSPSIQIPLYAYPCLLYGDIKQRTKKKDLTGRRLFYARIGRSTEKKRRGKKK